MRMKRLYFVDISEELETFLTYVSQLEFEARPDYARCKKIFSDALKRRKLPLDGKIDFSAPKSPVKKVRLVCRDPVAIQPKEVHLIP